MNIEQELDATQLAVADAAAELIDEWRAGGRSTHGGNVVVDGDMWCSLETLVEDWRRASEEFMRAQRDPARLGGGL